MPALPWPGRRRISLNDRWGVTEQSRLRRCRKREWLTDPLCGRICRLHAISHERRRRTCDSAARGPVDAARSVLIQPSHRIRRHGNEQPIFVEVGASTWNGLARHRDRIESGNVAVNVTNVQHERHAASDRLPVPRASQAGIVHIGDIHADAIGRDQKGLAGAFPRTAGTVDWKGPEPLGGGAEVEPEAGTGPLGIGCSVRWQPTARSSSAIALPSSASTWAIWTWTWRTSRMAESSVAMLTLLRA